MASQSSHRSKNSLKLLRTDRGAGVLRAGQTATLVRYQLDIYEERVRRTFGGSLEGSLGFAKNGAVAMLELASGEAVEVVLIKPDDEGADFRQGP